MKLAILCFLASLLAFPLSAQVQNAEQYELAKKKWLTDPSNPDNWVWYGRRAAYTGDYEKAISIYTDGFARFPTDARFLRHRGHRNISLRNYEQAILDFEQAAILIQGSKNQIEPDGMPNAAGIPVSTLHGNIWYHLGLAYYLVHNYEKAYEAYLKCRASGDNYDNIVSSTNWLFMIQQRMGNPKKADEMLAPIQENKSVIENQNYYDLCLFYKGLLPLSSLEKQLEDNPAADAILYGIANWYFYNGKKTKAKNLWLAMTKGSPKASFGYLAAESDLKKYFPKKRPNVLLIISDDLNTKIGPYMQQEEHTPHLDRLATEGVTFGRAYCQFPLCGPSRASLMSGLYPQTNKVMGNSDKLGSFRAINPALSDHPSMAGFFRENGYFTARVSKIFHMGVPGGIERGEPGGDDPDSWDYAYNVMGPETLSDGSLELLSPGNLHYGSNFAQMKIKDDLASTQTDYLATSQAIGILESRAASVARNARNKVKIKPEDPFFLAVGLVRPHVPLIAPENCFAPYPTSDIDLPEVKIGENVPDQAVKRNNTDIWKMDEDQQKKTISAYLASVRFMDQQVGRLLDALDRLYLRDETIVIFLSDHGYNLGEHNCWSKISLWEGSVRVPLIISYPGINTPKGEQTNAIVELIDLYPTLADLCGLSDQLPSILQGESIADRVLGQAQPQDQKLAYTISYGGKGASLRSEQYRYTQWTVPQQGVEEELYDHLNDPEEHVNLAGKKGTEEILKEMRKAMKKKQQKITRN